MKSETVVKSEPDVKSEPGVKSEPHDMDDKRLDETDMEENSHENSKESCVGNPKQ